MSEAQQRFLDLTVNEISVVDTPANEVEFLVMKRMEDESMEASETTEVEANKTGAEVVPVEAPASEDSEVTKALNTVAAMVESVAKAAGVNLATEAETTEEAAEKAAKTFDPRAQFGKQLKASGITGEAATKAMSEFDKAFKPFQPGGDTEAPEAKKTTKAADAAPATEPEATAEDMDDTTKALDSLMEAITKAKRFTPKREEAMKAALETLTKLLGEMQNVKPGTSPSTSTPGGASFGASGVQTLTKALEALTETVTKGMAENTARIESIEKARNPSKSIDDEGGTDTTETTTKSFWGGVL